MLGGGRCCGSPAWGERPASASVPARNVSGPATTAHGSSSVSSSFLPTPGPYVETLRRIHLRNRDRTTMGRVGRNLKRAAVVANDRPICQTCRTADQLQVRPRMALLLHLRTAPAGPRSSNFPADSPQESKPRDDGWGRKEI